MPLVENLCPDSIFCLGSENEAELKMQIRISHLIAEPCNVSVSYNSERE